MPLTRGEVGMPRSYPPEFRRKVLDAAIATMAAEGFPVQVACQVVGVAESDYYA
jgi:hypothetical protein